MPKPSCPTLHNKWYQLLKKEMHWTSIRRKIEAKLDRGQTLTRPQRDRVSVARQKENVLGTQMSKILSQARKKDCDIQYWGSPVPIRRASSKAPSSARRSFRSHRQELHSSMTCRPQCQVLADKAEVAFKAGNDKQASHYGNRYWRCVEDCYEHELPRARRVAAGKSRRTRRKYY